MLVIFCYLTLCIELYRRILSEIMKRVSYLIGTKFNKRLLKIDTRLSLVKVLPTHHCVCFVRWYSIYTS
jgi:hypothetical protein